MNIGRLGVVGSVFAFLGALSACRGGSSLDVLHADQVPEPAGTATGRAPLEALIPIEGCDNVSTYLRDRIRAEMNEYIDGQIEQIKSMPESNSRCAYEGVPNAPGAPSASGASGGSSGLPGSTTWYHAVSRRPAALTATTWK